MTSYVDVGVSEVCGELLRTHHHLSPPRSLRSPLDLLSSLFCGGWMVDVVVVEDDATTHKYIAINLPKREKSK